MLERAAELGFEEFNDTEAIQLLVVTLISKILQQARKFRRVAGRHAADENQFEPFRSLV